VTLEQREEEMEIKVHDNGTTNRELGGAARQSDPHEHRFGYNTDYVFADVRPLGSPLPMLAPQVHETNWDVLRRLPNEEIVRIEDVALQQKDFARLAGGRWLNDNLLDAYLKLIAIGTNHLHPRDRIRVMPSYFFTTLESIGYDNVRSYTRKENIFTYRYVYVPINFANKHWGLTVVDVRMGRMIYLDSVSFGRESRAASVFSKLADYFHTEHVANPRCAGTPRPIFRTRVSQSMPLQENGSDCGLFLCVAADYIAKGKNTDFSQKDMMYFRQRVHYELIVGARFND
jgi:Ulp1 family protease